MGASIHPVRLPSRPYGQLRPSTTLSGRAGRASGSFPALGTDHPVPDHRAGPQAAHGEDRCPHPPPGPLWTPCSVNNVTDRRSPAKGRGRTPTAPIRPNGQMDQPPCAGHHPDHTRQPHANLAFREPASRNARLIPKTQPQNRVRSGPGAHPKPRQGPHSPKRGNGPPSPHTGPGSRPPAPHPTGSAASRAQREPGQPKAHTPRRGQSYNDSRTIALAIAKHHPSS